MIKEYFKTLIHIQWRVFSEARLYTVIVFTIIFQFISKYTESKIITWICLTGFAYLALTVLKLMLFAFIINPIEAYKANHSKK